MAGLGPEETELRGYWLDMGSAMAPDSNWERIDSLTAEHLKPVAQGKDGREKLYRDPADGRLWELVPVEPNLAAGPPLLRVIERAKAEEKYGVSIA